MLGYSQYKRRITKHLRTLEGNIFVFVIEKKYDVLDRVTLPFEKFPSLRA